MTDPRTVGELEPGRPVLRVRNGGTVHLPDADCRHIRHRATRRFRAGVLFDDTPICRYCRDVVEHPGVAPGSHLPTPTEDAEL
jgi:hypothetical protein